MRRIVDLTATLRLGDRGGEWEAASTLSADGWNARTLKLYSHCGTHVDAPRHFIASGGTIDETGLEALVGPARVIDLTPTAAGEELTVERLAPWSGRIGRGARLLLRTDWGRRAEGDARAGNPHVGAALAEWLTGRGIALLGVEPHSVADTRDIERCRRVHRVLLEAGVVLVEGLCNLHALRQEEVELVVLPLKIEGGDGSPARAIAIEEADPA
jgi:kynurenine formamidase